MGQQKFSLADAVYGFLGHIFPSCSDALKLVEKGQNTPLKWHEKFALKYNSPLACTAIAIVRNLTKSMRN